MEISFIQQMFWLADNCTLLIPMHWALIRQCDLGRWRTFDALCAKITDSSITSYFMHLCGFNCIWLQYLHSCLTSQCHLLILCNTVCKTGSSCIKSNNLSSNPIYLFICEQYSAHSSQIWLIVMYLLILSNLSKFHWFWVQW